jgi:hypothetical protein
VRSCARTCGAWMICLQASTQLVISGGALYTISPGLALLMMGVVTAMVGVGSGAGGVLRGLSAVSRAFPSWKRSILAEI